MPHIQTQTEWEEEMSEKILKLIRHELYLDLRYFGPALSALAFSRTEGLLTFATDGMRLYYSTEPLLRVFQKNTAFLDRAYLHCVLHCLFRHLWLMGGRKKRLWSVSCDIVAEYVIDSMDKPSTKRILSLIRKNVYGELQSSRRGISAAVVYEWLKEKSEKEQRGLAAEFYTDDHRFWPAENNPFASACIQARENWEKTARQTELERNFRGGEQTKGEQLLSSQIKAAAGRRSYRDFLRKFTVLKEEPRLDPEEFDLGYYAYGLELYGNLPLIEPLETRETYKIREFVIVIDTSDSTSGTLVQSFLKETFSVLSQKQSFFARSRIRILQCDSQIQREDVVTCRREFERLMEEITLLGGGGTDFRPAFSYVELLRKQGHIRRLDGLLYFTDGKGIYPKKRPEYPTAFLFLEDYEETAVPPWAMRLRLEPEEWLYEYETGERRNCAYHIGLSGKG